jgi:hypothetical protein
VEQLVAAATKDREIGRLLSAKPLVSPVVDVEAVAAVADLATMLGSFERCLAGFRPMCGTEVDLPVLPLPFRVACLLHRRALFGVVPPAVYSVRGQFSWGSDPT